MPVIKTNCPECDDWRKHAIVFMENGGCPCCFCSDGSPHEKGCGWYEMEYHIRILEKSSSLSQSVAVSAVDRLTDKESYIFVLESAISDVCQDEITEPKWARNRLLNSLSPHGYNALGQDKSILESLKTMVGRFGGSSTCILDTVAINAARAAIAKAEGR